MSHGILEWVLRTTFAAVSDIVRSSTDQKIKKNVQKIMQRENWRANVLYIFGKADRKNSINGVPQICRYDNTAFLAHLISQIDEEEEQNTIIRQIFDYLMEQYKTNENKQFVEKFDEIMPKKDREDFIQEDLAHSRYRSTRLRNTRVSDDDIDPTNITGTRSRFQKFKDLYVFVMYSRVNQELTTIGKFGLTYHICSGKTKALVNDSVDNAIRTIPERFRIGRRLLKAAKFGIDSVVSVFGSRNPILIALSKLCITLHGGWFGWRSISTYYKVKEFQDECMNKEFAFENNSIHNFLMSCEISSHISAHVLAAVKIAPLLIPGQGRIDFQPQLTAINSMINTFNTAYRISDIAPVVLIINTAIEEGKIQFRSLGVMQLELLDSFDDPDLTYEAKQRIAEEVEKKKEMIKKDRDKVLKDKEDKVEAAINAAKGHPHLIRAIEMYSYTTDKLRETVEDIGTLTDKIIRMINVFCSTLALEIKMIKNEIRNAGAMGLEGIGAAKQKIQLLLDDGLEEIRNMLPGIDSFPSIFKTALQNVQVAQLESDNQNVEDRERIPYGEKIPNLPNLGQGRSGISSPYLLSDAGDANGRTNPLFINGDARPQPGVLAIDKARSENSLWTSERKLYQIQKLQLFRQLKK